MSCDSCAQVRINGVLCHETGCPNAWKDAEVFCEFCDSQFKPETKGQQFCCDSCQDSFTGVSRDTQEVERETDDE